jgi:uncharacterized protein (TIGR00156 family)
MGKKLIATTFLIASFVSAPVIAQFQGVSSAGGYTGPGSMNRANSVAAILKNPVDDQRVTLRGNITRHIGGDKYMFSDGTGEIRVDIDDHQFPPQPINEKTAVEIVGEVDTDFMQFSEIDVKSVRIVQ